MRFEVDYPVLYAVMEELTAEQAAETASTQRVAILTRDDYFEPEIEPRSGEFEFFFGRVRRITLSFLDVSKTKLTEAQTEEIVRMARQFPPGTVVQGADCGGHWTVILDQDGAIKRKSYWADSSS